MDGPPPGYRDAARPPARVYRLRPPLGAGLGCLATWVAVIALAVAFVSGIGFVLCFVPGVAVSTLGFLVSGAPRRIEVQPAGVTLYFWLRGRRVFPAAGLRAERVAGGLFLGNEGEMTAHVPEEAFAEGDLDGLAQDLADLVTDLSPPRS